MSVEVKNLKKSFNKNTALNDVTVSFESGKIYGLLGRNGAGKSTLLNISCGRLFANSGKVLIDGKDILFEQDAASKVFLISEDSLIPGRMTVKQSLKWFSRFYNDFNTEKALKLCEKFSLKINSRISGLSTGYNTILKDIVAFCVNTPYVFFDEPVMGLDANHRDLFYKILIEEYSEGSACYVVSTHLIDEVAAIVENVIIIDDGKVLLEDSCENLLSKGYSVTGSKDVVNEFIKNKNVIGFDELGNIKSAYITDGENLNCVPDGLEIGTMDLQKLFVQLTNS